VVSEVVLQVLLAPSKVASETKLALPQFHHTVPGVQRTTQAVGAITTHLMIMSLLMVGLSSTITKEITKEEVIISAANITEIAITAEAVVISVETEAETGAMEVAAAIGLALKTDIDLIPATETSTPEAGHMKAEVVVVVNRTMVEVAVITIKAEWEEAITVEVIEDGGEKILPEIRGLTLEVEHLFLFSSPKPIPSFFINS
jgi:hypothetical protein